jgi:hypothetical protein
MGKILRLLLGLLFLTGPALAETELLPIVVNGSTGQFEQLPAATVLLTRVSTTANASINFPPGVAPTTPTNGDCWMQTTGLFCFPNGSTVGPFISGVSLTAGNAGITLSPTTITNTGTISCTTATTSIIGCSEPDGTTITIAGGVITASNSAAMQITATASEALAAGAVVSLWNNSGVANVRNANATDNTKTLDGFVLSAFASSASAKVFVGVQTITGLSGLTPGNVYFLNTTNGTLTSTAPSTSGNYLQIAGKALTATTFLFNPNNGVQL